MKKVLAILTLGLFAAGAYAQTPAPAAEPSKEPAKVEKSAHKSNKTHATKHSKTASPAKPAAQ
ncbi:hypothetical protein AB4Z48_12335 [Cupriavidus sp. 2TAF22]|uniref:hypothetical protein n=1 Tax=unclassified Cupriavidus TaxID=2640874 RepID=UPI003F9333DF